jgi:hypothetical protein
MIGESTMNEYKAYKNLVKHKNRINHVFSELGAVRHGYPWVPTDQAHGRPRQVGSAYQKTRRPVSGPNRPSWHPTRPPEDFPEDSPDDLIHHDLKT